MQNVVRGRKRAGFRANSECKLTTGSATDREEEKRASGGNEGEIIQQTHRGPPHLQPPWITWDLHVRAQLRVEEGETGLWYLHACGHAGSASGTGFGAGLHCVESAFDNFNRVNPFAWVFRAHISEKRILCALHGLNADKAKRRVPGRGSCRHRRFIRKETVTEARTLTAGG